ncbi:hypothetical protein M9H77_07109 [Catharanthus roseus]|uniref:Uncharacterized protein n=1 Tax=Catharanthus roseus TaxID=4058 RepID=A0ACC0BTZ9_CATRO|nr:hypothetical protein M9H77_07109 [Catharanthus roseus]
MLISNSTRCFMCIGMSHIAINCPTKRTLVFSEDLNGWIKKSNDDFQEGSFQVFLKGKKLEEKMTKYLKGTTLPPTVALGLPSPVGFWTGKVWSSHPTADGRFYPTVANRVWVGKVLCWKPLLPFSGDEYPELVREFYATMLHKTDKNLQATIFTVKEVHIISDRDCQRDRKSFGFQSIKKTFWTGLAGSSSQQPVEVASSEDYESNEPLTRTPQQLAAWKPSTWRFVTPSSSSA